MIYQNNKKLNRYIIESGCYYLAILRIVELENRVDFSADDVNDLYDLFIHKGYLDQYCRILKPDDIIKSLLKIGRIKQIGVEKKGEINYWNWVDEKDKYPTYIIAQKEMDTKYKTHFVLFDFNYELLYDSLQGDYASNGVERHIFYKKL